MTPNLPIPLEWLPRFSAPTRNEILAAVATNGQTFGATARAIPQARAVGGGNAAGSTELPSSDANEPWSYPLNVRQAAKLVSGIDAGTGNVLKRIAENYQPEKGQGAIGWLEAKALTGAADYSHFARGHRSGLTRRLRKITGDADAVLLVENEDWDDRLDGADYTTGTFFIDGPAILALRTHFGL